MTFQKDGFQRLAPSSKPKAEGSKLKEEQIIESLIGEPVVQILKAGLLYFALVFGAGFVLGTIRTLWIVPRLGTRTAELMEAPIMLALTVAAARWIVRRFAVPPIPSRRLGVGCIALGLMLFAEFRLGLWLRGLSVREYLVSRDPVSGTVYYLMLGAFTTCLFSRLEDKSGDEEVSYRFKSSCARQDQRPRPTIFGLET